MANLELIASVASKRCQEIQEETPDAQVDCKLTKNGAVITIKENGAVTGHVLVESMESIAPPEDWVKRCVNIISSGLYLDLVVPSDFAVPARIYVGNIDAVSGVQPDAHTYNYEGKISKLV